ncbi:hypothetical protein [Halostella sp. PRR32]|uniref:hypothetical protein n=1 Tax=Halostella sp. PRR32 TaxID=3098147 RepID=UPI00110F320F|nr:hypothetical protein [Halostella sp. PRR32]
MKNTVYVLAVLVLFGVIAVPTLSTAFAEAPETTETVDNETVAISTSSWTEVSEADATTSFYDNETVYYNGSTVSESEYEWLTDNGSIRADENGSLANASNIDITYSLDRDTEFTALGQSVFEVVLWVIAALVIPVAGGVLIGAFGLLGGGAGGR